MTNDQTTFSPTLGITGKSQEVNGWIDRTAKFQNHHRFTKRYADATATLAVKAHPKNETLVIELEEQYEIKGGQSRTNHISVLLDQKNIDALEAMLAELKAAKSQAAA